MNLKKAENYHFEIAKCNHLSIVLQVTRNQSCDSNSMILDFFTIEQSHF